MIATHIISAAWKLKPILSTWKPDNGTIHTTLLFSTIEGKYALRAYRYKADDRWKIVAEHTLIAYVASKGLPAIVPLPLANGKTILEYDDRFYAVFPFASGHQVARSKLSKKDAALMGAFLGEVHQVLRDYPQDRVPQRSFVFDSRATLAKMDRLEDLIRNRPQLDEVDTRALAQLLDQRKWLAASLNNMPDFSCLEQQVIHGDYQEANLFFAKDKISAIIDWDQSYAAPCAWEVVRALDYAFLLDAALCRSFLQAYRTVLALSQEDVNIAAENYGFKRLHDVWVYETLYLEDNMRVRKYFQQEQKPLLFIKRWSELQKEL